MRVAFVILILVLFSCKKRVEPMQVLYKCDAREIAERPSGIKAVAQSTTSILVTWKKRGNQSSTVSVNGVPVFWCTCTSYLISGLQAGTTYQIGVNGEFVMATTLPDLSLGNHVVLLDFDGHLVSNTSWNYSGDFYATPSEVSAEHRDSVTRMMQWGHRQWPNVLVTESEQAYNSANPSHRVRVVFTKNSAWAASPAGTSFVGSYGTENNTCFVFTDIIPPDRYWDLAFIGLHEAGHTYGHLHTVTYPGEGISYTTLDWMGACYQCWFYSKYWGTSVMENSGIIVNRVELMNLFFQ